MSGNNFFLEIEQLQRFYRIDVPGAPQNLVLAKIGSTSATLTWEPPEYDGGNDIGGYSLERKEINSLLWTCITKVGMVYRSHSMNDNCIGGLSNLPSELEI